MIDTGEWLQENFGAASIREAAARIGMKDHKKLERWLNSTHAPWLVIALSREYGKNPVDRLRANGYLTTDEAINTELAKSLENATDLQLSEEIVRRVKDGGFHAVLNDPIVVDESSEHAVGADSSAHVSVFIEDDSVVLNTVPEGREDLSGSALSPTRGHARVE